MRSFARVVVVAGTPEQVAESMKRAEDCREQLEERGLLIVPLPIFNADNDNVQPASQTDVPPEASATGGAADLKFKALPLRQNEWAEWFEKQLGTSKATQENGLYLGLRMDGRVRTSGMGPAPWERFIAQIPPTSGMWQGLLDGLDGKV
ncbi:hypothetical protein WJX84_010997 [Apatococcus fuscideae]|uniref:Uncharacterized protein n=1 Tax=Apatococcus fuscideae TaxID=2026836 RepID=A0AAW1SCB7_9CHLO